MLPVCVFLGRVERSGILVVTEPHRPFAHGWFDRAYLLEKAQDVDPIAIDCAEIL